jgi:hypothetical protein
VYFCALCVNVNTFLIISVCCICFLLFDVFSGCHSNLVLICGPDNTLSREVAVKHVLTIHFYFLLIYSIFMVFVSILLVE